MATIQVTDATFEEEVLKSEKPVVLESTNSSWGGVYVQRADEVSIWQNAYIKNTAATPERGRLITGAVTFNESSLTLRNVTFDSSDTEDMLNVVLAGIDFENVIFTGARSDGFDGDAVIGRIEQASFYNIGGDGLDISASEIVGANMVFGQIGDKAISVGESSSAVLSNVKVTEAGFGIASKDLSVVNVQGAEFDNISHFSLASYEKKPEYGAATLKVTDMISDPGRVVVDTSSILHVNNRSKTSTSEDIAELLSITVGGS